ncbi:A24 family peptidase [Kitasatospora terrestris]|uniref:A24 family peptidase n=1 Tax=Kitasatospora terrestris TaxID=258051 RepID=A0ABP9DX46_9ACTN
MDWAWTGAAVGLLLAPLLRATAVRFAVPSGEPRRDCCPRPLPALPTGRCARCRSRTGPPPGSVEAVCAAVGWAVAATAEAPVVLLLAWTAAFGVVLAFVDAAVHRLPDPLTLPLLAGTAVLLPLVEHRPAVLLRCLLAAAALGLLFGLLALFAPLGFGDVKLAPALGAVLGLYGLRALTSGLFYTCLLAGLWAVALLLTRRAGRGTELAFGPAMLLGTLLALVNH